MNRFSLLFKILFVLFVLSVFSCSDCEDDCIQVTFDERLSEDFSSCVPHWVLVSETGVFELVAINLRDFDITPSQGLEACITYDLRIDLFSFCAEGSLVELISICEN